jgi:hypothetical protein
MFNESGRPCAHAWWTSSMEWWTYSTNFSIVK